MMMISLKNFFEQKKLPFDDIFLSLTFPISLSDFNSIVKSDNEIGKVNDKKNLI